MYSLKLLLILGSVYGLLGQFLSDGDASSEENAGQQPGPKETSCACGWTNKNGRIIGGKLVEPNEFPLMVGIATDTSRVFCGGSIITDRHVLTAAHCTYKLKDYSLRVFVGTHTLKADEQPDSVQIINVDHTIEHEDFTNKTYYHDIAILVLKEPIQFNKFVGPVCLPMERTDLQDKFIKAIGWGYVNYRKKTLPDHLMKVNLKVVPMKKCEYFTETYEYPLDEDNQICSYRRRMDTCKGDSGSPLIWNDPETNRFTQVAIVSYGSPKCGTNAAVNTNVVAYISWIKDKITASGVGSNICHKI